MNRKEGVIIGLVMLATFVTGVFASTPATQLLNVFVTNFPQNQQVTVTNFPQNVVTKILDENRTLPGFVPVFFYETFTAQIDVSQYSKVAVFYRASTSEDFALNFGDPNLSAGGPDAFLALSFVPPSNLISGPFVVGHFDFGGSGAQVTEALVSSVNIDQPMLTVAAPYGCEECKGSVRMEITVFLQR